MTGYILLAEENIWLRKSSVKAILTMAAFGVISALVSLIPNAMSIVNNICEIFGGYFYPTFISNIVDIINTVITVVEKLLFILLGLKAFDQGTVKVPLIDSIVNAYMS